MKRVASLYLPSWSIDRLLRQVAPAAPPERAATASLAPLAETAAAEQALQCDAPRDTGWRPGARWARETRGEVERRIAAMPAHQRPPGRELGRRSEAAPHPFHAMPPDEGVTGRAAAALAAWRAMPPERYPGDGPDPDKEVRRGSNDPHARVVPFFTTGRGTAGMVAQAWSGAAEPVAAPGPGPLLVTVEKVGPRVAIAAVSPSARAAGIEPGMALTQARAAVPELVAHDADRTGDAAELARLAVTLARRWTPTVAVSGDDGLLLDLTGVAHLHGGEARFARRLVRLLARHGVAARVAIADTAGAAWALARHAGTAICPPGAHREAIAGLPPAALRLDERTQELLVRLGVDTVAALLAMPRGPLVRRFGSAIAVRLDQATGATPEPLDPVVPAEAVVVEQRFFEPIATAEAIAHWLEALVPRLATALAEAGQGARALMLVAERVDGVAQRLCVGLARATRDPAHLRRLLLPRVELIEPGFGIDALVLRVLRAEPLAPAPIGEGLTAEPDLAPLVDAIANRIGPARLWRHAPVESDVPERAVGCTAPLEPPAEAAVRLGTDDVRRLDTRAPDHPWHPRWPRPARLLRRPERLDHVVAELPDQPPRRFTWRGQRHRVVRADGPERITGEWWKRSGERDAVRDYFQVEAEGGQRFWLFRRGDGERAETGDLSWYMHGAFA